jgi:amino acid adenylation domain-containing protein
MTARITKRAETIHLSEYLEASTARHSDRPAVVDPAGWSLSYRQLNERADRIAGYLVSRGVRRGDRVGLAMTKSAASVAIIFGILRAGAAYVPVDPGAPPERSRSIFTDCEIRALFLDHSCLDILTNDPGNRGPEILVINELSEAARVRVPNAVDFEGVLEHPPIPADTVSLSPGDLAYILYTSGSTGVPKGVTLTHQNGTSFVEWCSSVFDFGEHDRFSSHAPFQFDLSIFDLYVSIKHGGTVYLISEELGKNPRELGRFIADNRLNVWYSTPSILGLLAEYGGLERLDCNDLRLVLFAGEVFPVKHLRRLIERWPQPTYFNLYGPTETNVCTFARIPKPIPAERTEPYPIGWPCSHCQALVLDEHGQPVAPGEEGMLYIAGPSVFQGYWNRRSQNSTIFLERDDLRWYNTGDVVRSDPEDGLLYVGRRDRMVKRRGYRVELGEIESGLYRHEQIREAAVVATSDPQTGVKIVAFLVSNGDERPSIIELKQFCARQLPAYMSPDIFTFLNELPRTSTDKVDFQALVRSLQTPKVAGGVT